MSDRGEYEHPEKSAYSLERYDSSWEKEYMAELEEDNDVDRWTKQHGILIPYLAENNEYKNYRPDFLVQYVNGDKKIIELKGNHLLKNEDTKRKTEQGRKWCKRRGMEYILLTK